MVLVSGCPDPFDQHNGSFARRSGHNDLPRFENEHGMHLFYDFRRRQWLIKDNNGSGAGKEGVLCVRALSGLLPQGQHDAWRWARRIGKDEALGGTAILNVVLQEQTTAVD